MLYKPNDSQDFERLILNKYNYVHEKRSNSKQFLFQIKQNSVLCAVKLQVDYLTAHLKFIHVCMTLKCLTNKSKINFIFLEILTLQE